MVRIGRAKRTIHAEQTARMEQMGRAEWKRYIQGDSSEEEKHGQ